MKLAQFSLPGYPDIKVPSDIQNLSGGAYGGSLITTALAILFVFGIVLTIILLIYSGIQWVTSEGDKQKIQAARSRLIYTIVGFLIIAGSLVIVSVIVRLLGGDPKFFLNTSNTP
ncbi:MAG: hypothetical protein Q7R31_01870 [Candidatus Levybacteria bacterium]|nr:hypothetical protein [Candidatus Levybacteria bacterium]